MFSAADGQVTSRFTSRQYLQSCTRFGPEYAITDQQTETLDLVQAIANRPELRVSYQFQEGDIQLVNNHTTMHARDAFEDHDDPALKRHLLRMWIALSDADRRLGSRYPITQPATMRIPTISRSKMDVRTLLMRHTERVMS